MSTLVAVRASAPVPLAVHRDLVEYHPLGHRIRRSVAVAYRRQLRAWRLTKALLVRTFVFRFDRRIELVVVFETVDVVDIWIVLLKSILDRVVPIKSASSGCFS